MYHPQISSPHFSERHPSFLVCGGGGTTDFLPVPSVCFSKRASIYHFSMFCISQTLGAILAAQTRSTQTCLFLSLTRSASNPVTDSLRFAAGPQSPVVGHPFLEQLEPRRPAEPRQAAGPQLPFPGMEHQQVRKRSSSLLAVFWIEEGSRV